MLLGSKYKTLLAMPFLKTLQIVFLFEKLYPYFGMASSSSPLFFFMSQMYFCTLETETKKKQQKKTAQKKTEKKNKNQNSKTEKEKNQTKKKWGRSPAGRPSTAPRPSSSPRSCQSRSPIPLHALSTSSPSLSPYSS
jgi:hypothetical protein